jgi:hypothetical protein
MKALPFLFGMLIAGSAFAQTPTPAQRLMSDHAATENARLHEWESTVAWDKEIQAQLAAQADQIKWWSECWDGKIPGCGKAEWQGTSPAR